MTGDVLVEHAAGRLAIVLNRPAARNAISPEMLATLTEAIATAADRGVRIVTLRGAGGAFCAGADIASYADPGAHLDRLEAFTRSARRLCRMLEELPAVVVAAVAGPCLGGGFELALASDLIIADPGARFGLPEARLGLIPGWGGTQRLTRAIGSRRSRALILGATLLDAPTAHELGIVAELVPAGGLTERLDGLVEELAGRAPLAMASAKRAILAAEPPWPDAGAETETTELIARFASRDGAEGIAAFIEKRPPRFTGA